MNRALVFVAVFGLIASVGMGATFYVNRDDGINCSDQYDNQGAVSDVRTAKWGCNESYLMDFDTAAILTFMDGKPIGDHTFTLYIMPSGGWPAEATSVDVQTVNLKYDWDEGDDPNRFNAFGWTEGTPAATGEYAQTYWVDVGGTPTLDVDNCIAWTRENGTEESYFKYVPASYTNSASLSGDSADHGSYISVLLDENLVNDLLNNSMNRGLRLYRADGSDNAQNYTREAAAGQRPYLEVAYVGGGLPTVTLSATDANAAEEGQDTGTFTVSRNQTSGNLVVYYSVGGTAGSGDYEETLSGSVTIPDTQASTTITITPVDDSEVEPNETVVLTLTADAAYQIGSPSSDTVTIADNDGAVTVAFDLATSNGDEGVTPVNLSVSLSQASGDTVTVDYAVTGGSATGGGVDYTLDAGQLQFDPGQTTKNIPITIVDDPDEETHETIEVTLSNPVNASLGSTTVHTYTILDNDGTGQTWDVYTIGQLENATRNYAPGDEIVIHPGTYMLDAYLQLNTDDVVVRGSTGNRDDVILQGPGMNVDQDPREGLVIRGNDVTVMDLTISGIYYNGIHIAGELGIARTWINNVKTLNCGERHIKGSKGEAIVDDVIIENVHMLQTEARQSRPGHPVDPDDYIGGIDAMACRGWIVRDNVCEGIVGAAGGGRAGIFLWNGVENTVVERNQIFDCATGICIGNPSGPTGSHVDPWHSLNVIIRNNFVLRGSYIAFETCNSKDMKVYNNTFYSPDATYFRTLHIYDEPAEGQTTNLSIINNIIRGRILDNSSGDWSKAAVIAMGNIVDDAGTQVTPSWFVDVSSGDFHLTASATDAIDQATVLADVTDDFDEEPRGALPDMGGDESNPPGELPTVTLSATDADAAEEGQDTGTFTVSRDQTSGDLVVNYSVGGTAGSGDYEETLSGSVTIPDTQASTTITITPVDDSEVEGDETVILTLTADPAYSIGSPSSGTVTIADNDVPTVTLDATDASAAEEGQDTGTFTVTRDDNTGDLVVNYSVGGTAAAADYQETLTGSVTIPDGQLSVDITITPVDDSDVEGDETVILTLTADPAYSIGSPSNGTVTIADNDVPTVTLDATDASAAEEGQDTGTFTVTRDDNTGDLVVNYSIGGTAAAADYQETLTGSVTIPDGQLSVDITITPVDDSEVEGDETVILTLTADPAYSIGSPSSGTVTIADNDVPTVTLDATDASAAEELQDTGTFTVARDDNTGDLVVNYSVGGTAAAADYQETLTGSVTIPDGQLSVDITITPVDDSDVEGDETVILTLTADPAYSIGSPSSGTVTIADNDVPTVTLDATDASAAEEGQDTGTFTVTRDDNTGDLVVNYSVGGTAAAADYQETLTGSVTIPDGQLSVDITITPVDDSDVEGDETVILTLTADPAYSIGSPSSGTVTIADNDVPTVTLDATDASAAEEGQDTGTFTVTRDDNTGDLVVNYSVGGTAAAADYQETLTGSVTIPDGQLSVDITITPVDDSDVEGDETVILTLTADPAYSIGSPSSGTVTIADNDVPTVTLDATDASAAEEGQDTGTFTVTRDDNTGDLVVNYSVGGTAAAADYQETLTGSVTIPDGQLSVDITITPVDDSDVEGDETVILTLTADPAYSIGSPSSGTVTIADNDVALPVVTLEATDASAAEEGQDTGTFTVSRDQTSGNLVVNYSVGGSAGSGDYEETLSGSVTIPDTQASTTITITPVDDSEVEGNETVILTLTADPAYSIGSPSSGTVTIADNDVALPVVTLSATDASAAEEGQDTGTFTVSRDQTSGNLVVNYSVGGTAGSGDYEETLSGSVTIPDTQASTTITITPVDDSEVEGNETVILTLTADPAYSIGSPSSGTVTIADNDVAGPETLFSDGFESGDFTAGGWTTSGSASVTGRAAYSGSDGAMLAEVASMTKALSTVGYTDIHVKFYRKTKALDTGEWLYCEWSDDGGQTWYELGKTQALSWGQADFTCPAGAANNANFQVRLRTNADKSNEYGYVDDVEIIGSAQ